MQDPSQAVPRDLIPHIHLLSTYRFPIVADLHHAKAAEWLFAAPKAVRDQSPFYWTVLDQPVNGTVFLTWQAQSAVGIEYPSDGYIWPPAEQFYSLNASEGCTLEVYEHKVGYGPNDTFATRSRRRYRMLPPKFPNQSIANPDINLWIVHYSQPHVNDRHPINLIPIDAPRTQNIRNTRMMLQQQGQIVHKEFMINDPAHWPAIQLPRGPPRGQNMYGANMPPSRTPQAMAYPPQHPPAGPPAKRARTQATSTQNTSPGNALTTFDIEDEEDTSRGDLFDHTTPHEISMIRYRQNHEWMEELLSSQYSIRQITPSDLGLGLKGELNALTEGIFDAPYDPEKDLAKYNYVGQLEGERAAVFRKRADDHVTQTKLEISKMEAKHAKRLAKFKKGNTFATAEKHLRNAVNNPEDTGPEYWRLEGRIEEDEDGKRIPPKSSQKVEDILAQIVDFVGRPPISVSEVNRAQDGGFEEAPAIPSPPVLGDISRNNSQQSGVLIGDADIDMGGSAAGLLDQFQTGFSSNATPGSSFETPQAHLHTQSSVNTPSNSNIPSPLPHNPQQAIQAPAAQPGSNLTGTNGTNETAIGDWVVVPPGGGSPSTNANPQAAGTFNGSIPTTVTSASNITSGQPDANKEVSTTPNLQDEQAIPDFGADSHDFSDLADLDTAGEALAEYDDGMETGVNDLDLGMDIDDSAFGEAFHGVDTTDNGDVEGDL